MSVQINNTGSTVFTPEQQLELQKRLSAAKSQQEARAIFDAYKKEVGIVDNASAVSGNEPAQRANAAEKPVMGTAVEKTVTQTPKGEVIGQPVKSYSVSSSMIMERMGLADDNLKTEFMKFLSEQKNLSLDQDGNVNFDSANANALNDALKAFAEKHKANFVNPKAEKYIQFTEDSAPEVISTLGEEGTISEAPVSDRRYAVKNEEALRAKLDRQVGETAYQQTDARSASVEAGLTTTTTTKENILDIPADLRENRKERKQLQENAEREYANLAANADPELRNAIDLYVAERKYNKQIDKKMADMLEYKTTIGGTKEKKIQRDDADVIQMYINNYTDAKDKEKLNSLVNEIQNSTNAEDQQQIMDALKDSNVIGIPDSFEKLTPELKRKGALLSMAKACGYDSNTLLRLMATSDVLKNRSPKEVAEDDKYFAKEQANDFVKNQQVQQDVPNTTVHFSKNARKDSVEDGKVHTDIGKKGRALVKACPTMLCDEITDPSQFKEDEDHGYFKANINGKDRYFKFSQDKWKTFMGICCDPSRATDAEMEVLFGDDKNAKENFLKDLNMTLQEGRSVLDMKLPSPYGETGTLKFENIIGNSNNSIGNKELNSLRDMVESAGYSVDKNTTAGKRLLHVLKNAGIGAVIGIGTGGLGSLLSGALEVAGTTASQMVSYSGKTADRVISGTTADRVIHDKTTFKYEVNGEEYSKTVNKDINVKGQDWSQNVEGQEYSGQVEAKGQEYSGSDNKYLDNAKNAGILGAIGGAATGFSTMGRVHERGRNIDDVFALTKEVSNTEQSGETLSLEIPQFTTVETRSCQMEVGDNVEALPAVKWQGPAAYHVLYKYEDGTPVSARDFAKAYKGKINGEMSNRNFYLFKDLEVNGKKLVPVDNYKDVYKTIPEGVKGTIAGVNVNPQGKKLVKAQGTISS